MAGPARQTEGVPEALACHGRLTRLGCLPCASVSAVRIVHVGRAPAPSLRLLSSRTSLALSCLLDPRSEL